MSVVKGESSDASPVLFLNRKGEPLRFFIRPGPTKTQLQPLITRCGGIVCRAQESSAILLADPGEISTAVGSVGQFYISTQYVHDCVKQNRLLDIETYRFSKLQNPVQTRMSSWKQKGNGRMCYSSEDDAAIMNFIAKRRDEAKGNRVWQQMERQRVTTHSWQSMKDRFLKHLQYKTSSKSPETKQKNNPLKESSSSEQNIPQTSPEPHTPKKTPTKAPIASSSGSGSTRVISDVLTLTEGRAAGQSPLRSSPRKRNSTQCPYSGKDKPDVMSDVEKETRSDEPEQESPAEEHLHEQDREEHEVSPKKARGNQDVPVEVTSERPDDDQLIPPCEIRQKHPRCCRSSEKKLGILERAAREFEDSQTDNASQEDRPPSTGSSGSDSGSECQFTAAREMAVKNQNQPGHTEHPRDGDERSLLTQKSSDNRAPEDDGPGPSGATGAMASKAHMFLFDHESQEDLTQPSQDDVLSPDSMKAKLHVVQLMQQSEKGLVEVMKALLKASGDVSVALTYLLGGYDRHVHGPMWTKEDDKKLLSCDSSALRQLEEKFGAEGISKRQSFLKAK